MATWLTHLRVSERLINRIKISDNSLFFAGSIAPDSGISPDISHWCVNGDKSTCDVNGFFCKYLSSRTSSRDFDFYLGYYVHLLTDVMWQKQKIPSLKMLDKDSIRNVKESWRSVDYNFLSNQKEFYPIIAMRDTAKYEKQWFDYYTVTQIKEMVEYITNSCKVNNDENSYVDMNVKQEIEQFIEEASVHIIELMGEYELPIK
jgi:hypothetical protein